MGIFVGKKKSKLLDLELSLHGFFLKSQFYFDPIILVVREGTTHVRRRIFDITPKLLLST